MGAESGERWLARSRGVGRNMSAPKVARLRSLALSAALLALLAGCADSGPFRGDGGGGGGGGGAPPGSVTAPTLVNLQDAAPARVLALQLKINDIQLRQTTSAAISVLEAAGGVTVETTYRQGLPQPIKLNPNQIPPGTYDAVVITLATTGHAVTFVDDLGIVRQDAAPTITPTTVTVPLAPTLVVSTSTPLVANVNFLPSSVAINTTTNRATLTPTFTATLAFAGTPASGQTETTGLVRGFTGVVVSTPLAGATAFQLSSSQLADPITIGTNTSTAYSGDISAFGGIVGGNILQVTAQFEPNGLLLARSIDGENAGVGRTTGGDFRGVITAAPHSLIAPFNADSMSFRVQNVSAAAGAVAIGSAVTVDFTAIPAPAFAIDQQGVDLATSLPFTPTFDRVHINVGQEISSIYDAGATTAPRKIKLRLQSLGGIVGVISDGSTPAQKIIQFTLPADSFLLLLTGETQITVVQQPSTTSVGGATPVAGQPLHVRGLLFWDDASGDYFLVADQFSP